MTLWSNLVDVISSPSFLETTAVLLLTALLTGILVPVVRGITDNRNLKRQQAFRAEIDRQSKISDAQAELLESLADVLGGLRLLYMKIAFYGKEGREKEFDAAFRTTKRDPGTSWLVTEPSYQRLDFSHLAGLMMNSATCIAASSCLPIDASTSW